MTEVIVVFWDANDSNSSDDNNSWFSPGGLPCLLSCADISSFNSRNGHETHKVSSSLHVLLRKELRLMDAKSLTKMTPHNNLNVVLSNSNVNQVSLLVAAIQKQWAV